MTSLAFTCVFDHDAGMMKVMRFLALIGVVLVTGACVATTSGGLQRGGYSSIDSRHAVLLAQEYQEAAALMSANSRGDIARKFSLKAAEAMTGRWSYPETPGVDPALGKAYGDLTSALMFAMNGENAKWLARAQVNYDCWAIGAKDSNCRKNFDKAMQNIGTPERMVRKESIYFDDDSSVLSPASQKKLGDVAMTARMNKGLVLHLSGHSGGGAQNQSLALRRAIAVRNFLAQAGVGPERIGVQDESLSDTVLAKQKTETGTDPKTHRVDIFMEPQFLR